jgi:hypothetical protein
LAASLTTLHGTLMWLGTLVENSLIRSCPVEKKKIFNVDRWYSESRLMLSLVNVIIRLCDHISKSHLLKLTK